MCGIAGKLYFHSNTIQRSTELPLINKTLEKLHHRGPDDLGYIFDRNVWLGATRLKIIDLSAAGHQPMQNEDKHLTLVFNGEIYNYIELKKRLRKRHKFISHTDSEVLLHLYEEYGVDCLQFLRGMFAFAIWDSRKNELFLARDRLGKKPLKYFYNNRFFVFASELKAFVDHPAVPKKIDEAAIDEFLTFGYITSPRTGFKNIWKLPSAHYMIIQSTGTVQIQRYWQLDFTKKLSLREEEWEERILQKLSESVTLRLRSDVSLGFHLSGGVDSGIVTALGAIASMKPIHTISIGFPDNNYNELPYSREVAQKYNTLHHEIYVKSDFKVFLPKLTYQYEEPYADPSIIPTWFLMEKSKEYCTVVLNGDGGDENFAGYRRYKVLKYFTLLQKIYCKKPIAYIFKFLYRTFKREDFYQIGRILSLPYSDLSQFFFAERTYGNLGRYRYPFNVSSLEDIMRFDFEHYLPDDLLTKVDISSMVHSLEVRSPFLDHEFVELIAKMPIELKLKGITTKYILKKIANKYLPPKIIEKKKQGFLPPMARWIRGELHTYFKKELLEKSFLSYGLVQKDDIIKLLQAHDEFKANHAYALWTLLCFKNWLKIWYPL
ncbi:asparagine synthase (glutamine-hydrolyzing) [Candidatus Gottesmanbacteria bacterium]|nr:asparagine synthase (glutamine-hydrolyzing) [Candidatus Gottesmanbacteria bacterium]